MYSVFLSYISLLAVSLCDGSLTPAPAPSPTKFIEPRATTCNADNCYRAAKSINEDQTGGHYGSIFPLCSSFTSPSTLVTTLTSSPLILPSSCSAPRISSICDCLAPAPPCATRAAAQRVENPSFELGPVGGNVPYWSITDTANNWGIYNTNERDYQGNYGLTIWSDGASGVFTAAQTLSLCPGYNYAFSAYIGYAYLDDPSIPPVFNSNVTVYLNDQVIVPTQPACTSRAQCNKPTPKKPEGFEAGFRQLTASVTAPPAGSATLKIVISRDVGGNTQPGGYDVFHTADTLLDLITLTKAG